MGGYGHYKHWCVCSTQYIYLSEVYSKIIRMCRTCGTPPPPPRHVHAHMRALPCTSIFPVYNVQASLARLETTCKRALHTVPSYNWLSLRLDLYDFMLVAYIRRLPEPVSSSNFSPNLRYVMAVHDLFHMNICGMP